MLSRPLRVLRKLQTYPLSDLWYIHPLSDVSMKPQGKSESSPRGEKMFDAPVWSWRNMRDEERKMCKAPECAGWERSECFCSVLRLCVHPSFLLTLLTFCTSCRWKLGRLLRQKGGAFAVALLLAFVFCDPHYLRAMPLSILHMAESVCMCVTFFISSKELHFRHYNMSVKQNRFGITHFSLLTTSLHRICLMVIKPNTWVGERSNPTAKGKYSDLQSGGYY